MDKSQRLIDFYLPPAEGFVLESLVATTYQVDFEFFEEELLAAALGVRAPTSRLKAFRSELERRLQTTDVSVLYDLRGCERLARLSPRIDPIPITGRKLHSKISLLMWVRNEQDRRQPPDRRMRLIVGSANLTRRGFRENYECIAAVDYGGRNASPRSLLGTAVGLVRQIAAESDSPQLQRQLDFFETQANLLPEGDFSEDDPSTVVIAEQVVPTIQRLWNELTDESPSQLTVVSPFWPQGATASDALFDLVDRLQTPSRVELVCRGALSADGNHWLPEFDAEVATSLKRKLKGRLFLRAALPDVGIESADDDGGDAGDETEEHELAQGLVSKKSKEDQIQRPLHAKVILLDGPDGSVLYAGSSNCTRRGLGLGGPTNWEAGYAYRLTPKQRKQIQPLLAFSGPATEVLPDKPPKTQPPQREDEPAVPAFLSEVTASGPKITLTFRDGVPVPDDLVVVMEIPSRITEASYWLLYRRESSAVSVQEITADLSNCRRCDRDLADLPEDSDSGPIVPHVFVEVRWEGHVATFPVRFDDKATLPLLLVGRKPTEGELIEYFLFGREPGDDDGDDEGTGDNGKGPKADRPIDTRRILAYFIRRFVQAIPGIEAELQRASYSRTALEAALRGPTSPLELAERAFASLSAPPGPDEPEKTPTAVGFQLTEVVAALLRCRDRLEDASLKECFDSVIGHCRGLLNNLVDNHPELKEKTFPLYQRRFVGGMP